MQSFSGILFLSGGDEGNRRQKAVPNVSKKSPKHVTFTTAAIELLPSPSLKAWASSAHNLPIIQEAAKASIKNKRSPQDFATYLTLVAMG